MSGWTLGKIINYVEQHEGVLIIDALLYKKDYHILYADDGKYYIAREVAGYDSFRYLTDAKQAIDSNPKRYLRSSLGHL